MTERKEAPNAGTGNRGRAYRDRAAFCLSRSRAGGETSDAGLSALQTCHSDPVAGYDAEHLAGDAGGHDGIDFTPVLQPHPVLEAVEVLHDFGVNFPGHDGRPQPKARWNRSGALPRKPDGYLLRPKRGSPAGHLPVPRQLSAAMRGR